MPNPQFLEMMAQAEFVVVPLKPGAFPHGHTTVVEALRLGKPVISTQSASVEDYVIDGQTGLLVQAGQASGYRQAIQLWLEHPELRQAAARQAQEFAENLTYRAFAGRLAALCQEVLQA